MASANIPSVNEPTKDLILLMLKITISNISNGYSMYIDYKRKNLVHTVQLKPMIKAHFSGRMVSSGISDVAIASIHYEKTRLKK